MIMYHVMISDEVFYLAINRKCPRMREWFGTTWQYIHLIHRNFDVKIGKIRQVQPCDRMAQQAARNRAAQPQRFICWHLATLLACPFSGFQPGCTTTHLIPSAVSQQPSSHVPGEPSFHAPPTFRAWWAIAASSCSREVPQIETSTKRCQKSKDSCLWQSNTAR